ncbi:hypothetical protein Tco_0459898 [Tanacetum coccineum]
MGGIFRIKITSSGWPFVSAVPGQMAHLVTSITLDSARSYVMQNAFLTQGERQTFVCDHLILALEYALLPDPLAYGYVLDYSEFEV